ncbi:unnamed protein product [Rotaria sordida]|uniref:TLC domain-containing protein n=2 Tax=Rotaria sordida TaxID=392033 RepID=A0A814NXF5_9BILA|nr:unnamed protein product [Rotaria sordida]
MAAVSTFISNEWFWLPKNTTWEDFTQLKQEGNINLPSPKDLLYVFPLSGAVYLIEVLFERYIAKPIGRSFGIHDISARKAMKDKKTTTTSSSKGSHPHVSPLTKFSESCWRFLAYLSLFIYGVVVVQNKLWIWDTRLCWLNYPNQPLTDDVFWYYMIELSFYGSLLLSPFIDAKRKLGKMAIYAGAKQFSDIVFAIFAVTWFAIRLCYYPYKILYTTIFDQASILGRYPAYYVFNGLLLFLYALQWYWFYLICVTAIGAFKTGEVKDERSDSEDNDDEQDIGSGEADKDK